MKSQVNSPPHYFIANIYITAKEKKKKSVQIHQNFVTKLPYTDVTVTFYWCFDRYDYLAKGTFLSRKEDFQTKGRFYFKILKPPTIIVHVLSFKWLEVIGHNFCITFTSF